MVAGDGGHVWFPRASDPRIQELMESTSDKPTIPDLVFKKLGELGYTGSIDDRWHQHLAALGYTSTAEPFSETLLLGGGSSPKDRYFQHVTSLLAFEGADAATTDTDLSEYGNEPTFVGNAVIDTAQFKFGTSSLYLDGSSSCVSVPANANNDFDIDNGEFTWESWVRFDGDPGTAQMCLFSMWADAASLKTIYAGLRNNAFLVYITENGSGTSTLVNAAWNPAGDTWYHVAVVRDQTGAGDDVRVYIDGVQLGSGSTGTVPNWFAPATDLRIGAYIQPTVLDDEFIGWFDQVRFSSGLCRYPSGTTFSVPTEAFATGRAFLFRDVALQLALDGTDAATTTTDESNYGHTISFFNGAELDTALAKYGTASLELDGITDYCTAPFDYSFKPLDSSFTVEFDFAPSRVTGGFGGIMGIYTNAGTQKQWQLFWTPPDTTGNLQLSVSTTGTNDITAAVYGNSGIDVIDTWYHVAAVIDRDLAVHSTRLYVDGVELGEDTTINTYPTLHDNDGVLDIGRYNSGSLDAIPGHLDNIRITKGVARYKGPTFTPPTAAFDTTSDSIDEYAYTTLLLDMAGVDGATDTIDLSPTAHDVQFVGTTCEIDTAVSKFGGSSLQIDPTGVCSIPQSIEHDFGSESVTLSAHVRYDRVGSGSNQTLFAKWNSGANNREYFFRYTSASNILEFAISSNGADNLNIVTAAFTPVVDTWYHLEACIDRSITPNQARIFIDGVLIAESETVNTYPTVHTASGVLYVGKLAEGPDPQAHEGYVDNARVLKGIALHDATFTPPDAEYPTS